MVGFVAPSVQTMVRIEGRRCPVPTETEFHWKQISDDLNGYLRLKTIPIGMKMRRCQRYAARKDAIYWIKSWLKRHGSALL